MSTQTCKDDFCTGSYINNYCTCSNLEKKSINRPSRSRERTPRFSFAQQILADYKVRRQVEKNIEKGEEKEERVDPGCLCRTQCNHNNKT